MTTPAMTDRHGFLLHKGNIVEKIADGSRFVVTEATSLGTSPVACLLKDGNGGLVDASLVMLTEEEKTNNSWDRATFCEVCFNHYKGGVAWFKTRFDHPERTAVYSACNACLTDIDPSTLPEISWVA